MAGGGGGGGSTETIVRYPDYMEEAHEDYIETIQELIEAATGQSPYADYDPVLIDEGFFGIIPGDYPNTWGALNFPSLWDMYGKFVGDNDVHVLWAQHYEDVIHGPEIANAISAHADNLEAEAQRSVYPRFNAGMRDINAVQSTAFIVGRSIIESEIIRQVNDFGSRIRMNAVQLSAELWKGHIQWSQNAISLYLDMFVKYYATRMDIDRAELEYADKDVQYDMNLWDHMRAALGAMSGAASASGGKPSQAQSALAGAMGGASMGFAIGGPWGAAAGAVIGAGISFL
jgi:hypothetical protein